MDEPSDILCRIKGIFNKDLFSDVKFLVGDNNAEYPSHKLILSLASPVFAKIFYGSDAASDDKIHISDVQPNTFLKFLEYIYTDNVGFENVSDARHLSLLAEKYQVDTLKSRCIKYMKEHAIQPEQACKMFEVSVSPQVQSNPVREMCLRVFMEETKAVFKSRGFLEAQMSTVEVIIANDVLAIDNEMELLQAVLEWGKAQCHKKNVDVSCNLRNFVLPLLKYVRFLIIPLADLQNFFKTYDILSNNEVCALTVMSLQPKVGIVMPETLCSVATPRTTPLQQNKVNELHHDGDGLNPSNCNRNYQKCTVPKSVDAEYSNILTYKSLNISCSKSEKVIEKVEACSLLPFNEGATSKVNNCLKNFNTLSDNSSINSGSSVCNIQKLNVNESHAIINSENSVKKYVCNNANIKTLQKSVENLSDSDDADNDSSSDEEVRPCVSNCKAITIKLDSCKEVVRGMRPVDVVSTVGINVIQGKIKVIGLTIHIKKTSYQNTQYLPIIINIKTRSGTFEEVHKKETSQPFDVIFKNHVVACEKDEIIIKVTVDDLQLQRCYICTEPYFRCNGGFGNLYEISASCNQIKSGQELPFLIRKILYETY